MALLRLGKFQFKELSRSSPLFFFPMLLQPFFSEKQEWENISFSISFTRSIAYLGFAVSSLHYCVTRIHVFSIESGLHFLAIGAILLTISLSIDFLAHLFAH
ncbi:MAG: hypothetical protein FJZ64_04935, partial [Chlamydiae bacterium]|nr:hypothetical protein [Chlamydiota bacterium]